MKLKQLASSTTLYKPGIVSTLNTLWPMTSPFGAVVCVLHSVFVMNSYFVLAEGAS